MHAKSSNRRLLLIRVLGSLFALLLLVVLLREEDWADISGAIRRVSPTQFILALALLFVSRFFVVGRWYILLRSAGMRVSLKSAAWLTFTGLFASNFLPTTIGGDVARLAGAIRMGFDKAISVASLVVDRLIGMFGMLFALPFGLVPLLNSLDPPVAQSFSIGALTQALLDFTKRTFSAFAIWTKKPLALLLSLCFTWGNMIFIFAAIYILIGGFGKHVSYELIAGLWSLTYFISLIPVSINGLGVQEFSLTFLLSSLGGLDNAESLTIAVLVRLLFILASLPGAVFLPSVIAAMKKEEVDVW